MEYKKISQIAKGWSSYIWLAEDEGGKEWALKEVREKSPRKDLANREGKMLLLANSAGVGPKVGEVNYEKNFVTMELIKGKKLFDWITNLDSFGEVSAQQVYDFIKELYRQCEALDDEGLSHNQLQVGKNILVKEVLGAEGKKFLPVIIDFEKATVKRKGHTKNLGQVMSMLFYNPHGIIAEKVREKLNLIIK